MATIMVSPRLIGRGEQLGELLSALALSRAGAPRAVIIRGEAGIGKTRLVQELIAEASILPGGPPLVVVSAVCSDLGPIATALTPIRRVLRELYAAVGDAAFRAAAGGPAVISTLGTLVPELQSGDPAPAGGSVAEAVERLFETLSADRHLLVVIEDLHWADAATLALLRTLASTLRGTHLMLVLTYRSDDVGRGHPLLPVLAELERSRFVSRIDLPRLSPDAVRQQVAALLGREADRDTLARIVARADGVPFFVEELVGLGDGPLPDSLRTLVLFRTGLLSARARRVVGAVAAAGMRVDHDMLAAVVDASDGELERAVRDAVDAGVLVGDGDGYAFRHALIREAVHDELLAGQRLDLHRRYARVLQARADAGDPAAAAQAAAQWLAARDDVQAFYASATALHAARGRGSAPDIAVLGERMLALWDRVPDAEVKAEATRVALVLEVFDCLRGTGDKLRAERLALHELEHRDATALEEARLRIAIGDIRVNFNDADGMLAQYRISRRLLESAGAVEAAGELADVLSRLATCGPDPDQNEDPHALLAEALQLAEVSGDDTVRAKVLIRRAYLDVYENWGPRSAVGDLRAALELRATDYWRMLAGHNLVDALVRAGRFDEAIDAGRRFVAESVSLGVERGSGSGIHANLADALTAVGRVDEAIAHAERAMALRPDDVACCAFGIQVTAVAEVWDDRIAQAGERLRADADAVAESESGDPDMLSAFTDVRLGAALIELETATPTRRRALLEVVAHEASALVSPGLAEFHGLRRRLLPAVAWALRVLAGHPVEPALRAQLLTDLELMADDEPARITRALVAAESMEGAGDAAERTAAWTDAVAAAETRRAPLRNLHYARYRLARARLDGGDRIAAAEDLRWLTIDAAANGGGTIARWAEDLLRRARLGGAADDGGAGIPALTPRELQVLGLVAEGLTNAEIGRRLFISPKTTSVHVSAILAKVGAANRAEAAARYAGASTES